MKIAVFLGHPAQFHLFKNVIKSLIKRGHEVHIIIKKKDILEELLKDSDLPYTIVRGGSFGRSNTKWGLIKSAIETEIDMTKFLRKNKITLFLASTISFSAKVLNGIDIVVLNEDDAALFASYYMKTVELLATEILTPETCNAGKRTSKTVKYNGYHGLTYLHPNIFTPNIAVVEKYFTMNKPYFILRLAELNAHHDNGITGINTEIAQKIIDILLPYGDVYITSERELEPQFEQYRIKINPLDMHHVMAFAQIYIGDSQSMAKESAILGVPFIRVNDFVGRIGVLRELEDFYQLGYGIKPSEVDRLYKVLKELLEMPDRQAIFKKRQEKMLSEKIDYEKFLTWFVENYPESKKVIKENPDYQYNFK